MTERDAPPSPGQWIKRTRAVYGMTQAELAARLGITPAALSTWEINRVGITDDKAERIARAFEMSIIEVRRGLGLFLPDDLPEQSPADPLDALRRDPRLGPEQRDHIVRQYKLLVQMSEMQTRIAQETDEAQRARLELEAEVAEAAAQETAKPVRRPHRRKQT